MIKVVSRWHEYGHTIATLGHPSRYELRGTVDDLPPNCRKAVAWESDAQLHYHGSAPFALTAQPAPTTLSAAIRALDADWFWAVKKIEWTIDPACTADGLRNGTAKAITNGSFKESKGTAGFAIVTEDGSRGIYGMNRTPGPADAHCLYRSENGGIVGLMYRLLRAFARLSTCTVSWLVAHWRSNGWHPVALAKPPGPLNILTVNCRLWIAK
jgi:hypothetical protein